MTLDARLTNWGRAWRMPRHRPALRRSVESRARSVMGAEVEWETGEWIGDGPPKVTLARIDLPDAIAVEFAVCALPLYDHAILRAWYVHLEEPWQCLKHARECSDFRRSGLADAYPRRRRSDFDTALLLARVACASQLAVPAVVHKARALAWVRRVLGTGLTPVNVAVD